MQPLTYLGLICIFVILVAIMRALTYTDTYAYLRWWLTDGDWWTRPDIRATYEDFDPSKIFVGSERNSKLHQARDLIHEIHDRTYGKLGSEYYFKNEEAELLYDTFG